MTIWLLALILFGCVGYAGWTLGAMRAMASFVGLLVACYLAFPLGHLFNPLFSLCGLKNPFILWWTGPVAVYLILLMIFKIVGYIAARKVDVYFKYTAGELHMGLWNRLNPRLGACFGVANAAVYLALICWVAYVFSYATFQFTAGDNVSWKVKTLNLMGRHVQSSGMAKVAAAMDPTPADYYDAVDIIGMIYHNDLLESRLSRYPGFLSFGQKPEFQDIANDTEFTELRQKQPAFSEIVSHPKAQAILNNPDMLRQIWAVAAPDLQDIKKFLETGESQKYTEPAVGRWTFDLSGSMQLIKASRPTVSSEDMKRFRRALSLTRSRTTLIIAPDKQFFMKGIGKIIPATKPNTPPTVETQNLQGSWSVANGKYQITVADKSLEAGVEGDWLSLTGDPLPLKFAREY